METYNLFKSFSFSEIKFFLVILAIILVLSHLLKKRNKKLYNLPPGPIGLPVLGYLPFLKSRNYLTLAELGKKYGNCFSFYLGQTLSVVCNDWRSAEEAFSKTETLDRPEGLFDALPNGFGFGGDNGKEWQEGRRFMFKTLRNIGFGKHDMDQVLEEEIEETMKELHKYKGQTADVRNILNTTFTNNIMTLLFGKRLSQKNPTTLIVSDVVDSVSELFTSLAGHNFLPKIYGLLVLLGLYGSRESMRKIYYFATFFKNYVDKEIENHNNNENVFVQIYQKETKSNPWFKENSIYGNAQLILFAASETSRTATVWLLLAVAEYPDVQKKIQNELDSVLGKDGTIKWSERDRVPYTYAAVLESLRWKTLVPVNTLRITNADTKIQGYDVPKGTVIVVNQWAIHSDPTYWPEPEKFDPQRFLTKDGKIINSPKSYIPFSYGKRNCPGKNIALLEIFQYFVSIMRDFIILPPEDGIKYDALFGLTYQATSMNLRLLPREEATT